MGKEPVLGISITKPMCKKVGKVIKPGDLIIIDSKEKPNNGDYVFVMDNELSWIEKYSPKLDKHNVHKIVQIRMNN